ncbi:MAG: o-succinylbenzoate--CoA ligase, partial [Candidatus Binatia bacterium]
VSLAPPSVLDPEAIHTILYTSGTTGRPKGAMLTNGNHLASATGSRRRLGVRRDDCWLALLPLYHVGGLSILLRSVLDEAPVVLQSGFDAARADRTIREGHVTLVSVVPTMLQRMVDENGSPQRLRCLLVGGGPTPTILLDRATADGFPVAPTYGLTEAASQVATAACGEARARPRSSGRPLPGTSVRIDAPDGDGLGEVLVRGPTVMAGYFRAPEATAEALSDGWLHTGDVGRLDDEGFLYVYERRRDLIISGGENVYPAEVEAVLLAHPDVREAAVYSLPDPEWGQRVAAAVILRERGSADVACLRSWCARHLARFKIPRSLELVSELPRTASGKVRRHELGLRRECSRGHHS